MKQAKVLNETEIKKTDEGVRTDEIRRTQQTDS